MHPHKSLFDVEYLISTMPAASYLPADDVEVRQHLINQIHDECALASSPQKVAQDAPEATSQAIFWSVLQILDVATLGSLLRQLREDNENDVYMDDRSISRMVKNAGKMVRIFLMRPPEEKDNHFTQSASEPGKALVRDNHRCIITGRPTHIEVCYIFPFNAINRMRKTGQALVDLSLVWGGQRIKALRQKLVQPKSQIIDTAANMLCMDRPAREMWSKGMFALEPLGYITEDDEKKKDEGAQDHDTQENDEGAEDDDKDKKDEAAQDDAETSGTGQRRGKRKQPTRTRYGIKLRLHLLKRTTLQSPAQTVDFAEHPSNIWRPENTEPLRRLLDVNGRPIDDGQIIKIYSHNEDELPDLEILQLRWDVYRINASCGGADPAEFVRAFPFDDDEEEGPVVSAGPTSPDICVRCGIDFAAR